jgi:hypothetical protein
VDGNAVPLTATPMVSILGTKSIVVKTAFLFPIQDGDLAEAGRLVDSSKTKTIASAEEM